MQSARPLAPRWVACAAQMQVVKSRLDGAGGNIQNDGDFGDAHGSALEHCEQSTSIGRQLTKAQAERFDLVSVVCADFVVHFEVGVSYQSSRRHAGRAGRGALLEFVAGR